MSSTERVAEAVSPEVKIAAIRAVLSKGDVKVSEILRGKQAETLTLVQRLLASAEISNFSLPVGEEKKDELHPAPEAQAPAPEISPEQAWLNQFKTRFDALPQLHQGVQWTDVEKTLKADSEAMRKLQLLDSAGFEMNVFGEKNGEIVFRTAQTDVTRIASKYRTIMADKKAQTDYPQYNVNGNAEEIALSLGVEVADLELYEQYRVQNGWVWLKTDATTRTAGSAFYGHNGGLGRGAALDRGDGGSFCAALRVKKS